MATLQIKFKDGKFISNNGVNVENFTSNNVKGNGWQCNANEFGEFSCIARKSYYGVKHQLKFYVKKGYVKTVLRVGSSKSILVKSYKADKWPMDGVIGLPSGFVDDRRPYFRNEEFQKFLDEYGITAVRYDLAGGMYQLDKKICDSQTIIEEKIETDGRIEVLNEEVLNFDDEDKSTVVERSTVEVSNASWVIKYVFVVGTKRHKILITMDNPKEIEGLPKD